MLSTRLPKQQSYRLEDLSGVAARCDWFVHSRQCLRRVKEPRTIFVSAFHGHTAVPYLVAAVLPQLRKPVRLVLASEDYTFPRGIGDARCNLYRGRETAVAQLIAHPMIERIFVENLDTLHDKLEPLPLGCLLYEHGALYAPLLHQAVPALDRRSVRVICCHRTRGGAQWEDRKRVSALAAGAWRGFTRILGQVSEEQHQQALLSTQFCLCVHGGGLDPSPRAWQALLCGAIPIVKHSTLDAAYARFPCAWVDSWDSDAVSDAKLTDWLTELRPRFEDPSLRAEVLRMLTIDFWWERIEGKNFQEQE